MIRDGSMSLHLVTQNLCMCSTLANATLGACFHHDSTSRSTSVGVTTPIAMPCPSTTYTLQLGTAGAQKRTPLKYTVSNAQHEQYYAAQPCSPNTCKESLHPLQHTSEGHTPDTQAPVFVMIHQLIDGLLERTVRLASDERQACQSLAPATLLQPTVRQVRHIAHGA